MRKLVAFNFITLNGYFAGLDGDISWHKNSDPEKDDFAIEMLWHESTLLFGRVTYELMAGYWPSKMALENDPVIAGGMNRAEKIVFSKTLKTAEWNNTKIISGDIFKAIEKMKQTPGNDMAILGSGSIITQFAERGLIDEYQFMIDPVVIGEGTSIFKGVEQTLELKLISTRTFDSGALLLTYEPV